MRELKREEYGAISGGQEATNLHTVFVDGAPSSSGTVEITSGSRAGQTKGDGGGSAKVTFGPDGNLTSATVQCPAGTTPSITTGAGKVSAGAKTIKRVLGVNVGLSGAGGSVGCVR